MWWVWQLLHQWPSLLGGSLCPGPWDFWTWHSLEGGSPIVVIFKEVEHIPLTPPKFPTRFLAGPRTWRKALHQVNLAILPLTREAEQITKRLKHAIMLTAPAQSSAKWSLSPGKSDLFRVSCRPIWGGGDSPPPNQLLPPPKFLLTLFLITLSPPTPGYSPPKVLQLPPKRWNPAGNPAVIYCGRRVQTAYAGGFLSYGGHFFPMAMLIMLHISLLRCTFVISLLRCTFLSYPGVFLSYAAHFSPTLADFSPPLHISLLRWQISLLHWVISLRTTIAKFLFLARIYLAEQWNT